MTSTRAKPAFLAFLLVPAGWTQPLPRTVLGFYDSRQERLPKDTLIHRLAEMPLNHLGLVVQYHDVNRTLPSLETLGGVRGVVTWFVSDSMADPSGFIRWMMAASRRTRLVSLGDPGVQFNLRKQKTPDNLQESYLRLYGVASEGDWTQMTYDARIVHKNTTLLDFERPLRGNLPGYELFRKMDPAGVSHLTVRRGSDSRKDANLVVTGEFGGFVAQGYTHYADEHGNMQWMLNPFEFFREAFDTDRLPKPDTTTVSGRRIYYSHIDGDGWRNQTEDARYRDRRATSAEVIFAEAIVPFSDLPVTVGPVAADLDPAWRGAPRHMELARKIFAQPNVEAGSHTYTHPLDWSFFEHYDRAKERLYHTKRGKQGYEDPRTYDDQPFDLTHEIAGSAAFLAKLLPPGKKVKTLQWPGNTTPFEGAVAAARQAGLRNINGGDTRLDGDFPSCAWVAPVGRAVGGERQIYSSNSNENTYTALWTERFNGFQLLSQTIQNTERPRRLKPFNLYYHFYSGEKTPALVALLTHLRQARGQKLAPVATSQYIAIAEGFYTTNIVSVGPDRWQIEDRGELQTIRFDGLRGRTVDYANSRGVAGHQWHEGSLYVALDPAEMHPLIALRPQPARDEYPAATRPYLVEGRWRVWNLRISGQEFRFVAQGYGTGDMAWRVPDAATYQVQAPGLRPATAQAKAGLLHMAVQASAIQPIEVVVRRTTP